jgi:hypothetical protein
MRPCVYNSRCSVNDSCRPGRLSVGLSCYKDLIGILLGVILSIVPRGYVSEGPCLSRCIVDNMASPRRPDGAIERSDFLSCYLSEERSVCLVLDGAVNGKWTIRELVTSVRLESGLWTPPLCPRYRRRINGESVSVSCVFE